MMKKITKNAIAFFTIVCASSSSLNAQITIFKNESENPSDNWSVYVKGLVQTDIMVSFQEMSFKDGFLAPSISVPQLNSMSSNFSVKQSQLGLGVKNSDIKAYTEIDFYGANGTTAPRLRHAYVEYKNWIVGQTWSNSSDIEIFPNIFDFIGPNGVFFNRRVQVRYTSHLSKNQNLSFSLEDPSGITVTLPEHPSNLKKKNLIPIITSMYRYGDQSSYVKVGASLMPINYEKRDIEQDTHSTKTILGYGLLVSGKLNLNSSNSIGFQTNYGKGATDNNIALDGAGYAAVPNLEDSNKLEALGLFSIVGIYEHSWTSKWSTVAYYSYSKVGNKSYIPRDYVKSFQNAGLNLVYQPIKKLRLGIEGNYGRVQKFNDLSANAFRIQCSTALSF